MPEHYSSIGEAVGAAMQHNIRLAHRDQQTLTADQPLQVRYIPPPTADPRSLPGMVVRLEEDASPGDVAAIFEETTSALVGPLTQLTELVAAGADWARARVDFASPGYNLSYDTWARLATAHQALLTVREDLETTTARIPDCPAEPSRSGHSETMPVLRTRELLHDVMGSVPPPTSEAQRRQAAVAGSPRRVPQPSTTPEPTATPTTAPAAQPRRTR
ncbi:hypothetical protein [Kitasatospora sp. MBT63]|uniref:hypothetical protein n=1 Tax=Kitasatospora sp. MBT63 TaxID=1444768 RepID=UPI00053A91A9|nr:hypothetical protein [Kitasatospora sp. MBT63]